MCQVVVGVVRCIQILMCECLGRVRNDNKTLQDA
jgi:hypothetical protein